MSEKTFTIQQIKYYLEGNLIRREYLMGHSTTNIIENRSLKDAMKEIDDPNDGIEASVKMAEQLDKENDERENWN